ncbi:SRPBCC family protein [Sphingobacterium spiritivorum]|uniref:SRPBCC family protein n=1 Tax=Sphingobacterium spiritivorum TaxID=258 RepID=UPI0019197844|nr:SRPBCC family protein [Sphingobacterium spiritivorum]QQT26064.1 SRPBCC family protein [Sphingobacterium spiritivorum]
MPTIRIETLIKAPIERVFDLSRSIDIHQFSTRQTNEKAIAGRLSGLIELHETVTWRARHFGIYQKLSVAITAFDRPHMFEDKMLKGAFKSMEHIHLFEQHTDGTLMIDKFTFEAPLGLLGRIAEKAFLRAYMADFLKKRNEAIKSIAEGEQWRHFV